MRPLRKIKAKGADPELELKMKAKKRKVDSGLGASMEDKQNAHLPEQHGGKRDEKKQSTVEDQPVEEYDYISAAVRTMDAHELHLFKESQRFGRVLLGLRSYEDEDEPEEID